MGVIIFCEMGKHNDHAKEKRKVEERFEKVFWGPEVSDLGAIATGILFFFDGGTVSGPIAEQKLKELGSWGAEAAVWLLQNPGTVYGGTINIDHWETIFGRKIYYKRSYRSYVAINKTSPPPPPPDEKPERRNVAVQAHRYAISQGFASGYWCGEQLNDQRGIILVKGTYHNPTYQNLEFHFVDNIPVAAHRWARSLNFGSGYWCGEDDGTRKGIVCLHNVEIRDASVAELEEHFPGNMFVASHRWARSKGFVSGYYSGEHLGDARGIVCIPNSVGEERIVTVADLDAAFPPFES